MFFKVVINIDLGLKDFSKKVLKKDFYSKNVVNEIEIIVGNNVLKLL